jgi:hypothetical protein
MWQVKTEFWAVGQVSCDQGAAENHSHHSIPNESTSYDTDFMRFRNVSRYVETKKTSKLIKKPGTAVILAFEIWPTLLNKHSYHSFTGGRWVGQDKEHFIT